MVVPAAATGRADWRWRWRGGRGVSAAAEKTAAPAVAAGMDEGMTGVGRDGAATPAPAAVAAATDTGRRWPRRCGGPRLEARVADDGRRGTTRIHPPEISEIVGQCVSPAARTPPLDSARRVGDGRPSRIFALELRTDGVPYMLPLGLRCGRRRLRVRVV